MPLEAKVYCLPEESDRVHIDTANHFYIVARNAESLDVIKGILESKGSAFLTERDLSSLGTRSPDVCAHFVYIREEEGKCQVGRVGIGDRGNFYALSRKKAKSPGIAKGKYLKLYDLSKLDKLLLMSTEIHNLLDNKDIKDVLKDVHDPEEIVEKIRGQARLHRGGRRELTNNDILVYIQPVLTDSRAYTAQLEARAEQLKTELGNIKQEVEQAHSKSAADFKQLQKEYQDYKSQKVAELAEKERELAEKDNENKRLLALAQKARAYAEDKKKEVMLLKEPKEDE